MPISRQLDAGIEVIQQSVDLQKNFTDIPLARVYHPRQAPSSVTSENFLASRATMNPGFVHNVASTKLARVSNMYNDIPKFKNILDILI